MKGEGTHGDVEQATGRKGKGSFKGELRMARGRHTKKCKSVNTLPSSTSSEKATYKKTT